MRRFSAMSRPRRAGLWTHFRFNPGVLVILATAAVVFFLFREAVTAFVRVRWSEAAPVIGFPNGSIKIMPVSTMPRLPGLGRVPDRAGRAGPGLTA